MFEQKNGWGMDSWMVRWVGGLDGQRIDGWLNQWMDSWVFPCVDGRMDR